MQAIRHLLATETSAVEVERDTFLQYNAELDAALAQCIWSHKGMTSYYRNDAGRIVVSSPLKYVDYWERIREFDPGDYQQVEVATETAELTAWGRLPLHVAGEDSVSLALPNHYSDVNADWFTAALREKWPEVEVTAVRRGPVV